MTDVVRHNLDTDRVITACECGRTVSLPAYAISHYVCECGREWLCDMDTLAMYEKKKRIRRPKHGRN